ncbi:MAG: hypothetical protein IJ849_09520 [Selenomonadaceae bacterium]|nr:hypothetical protein [Selenomonadaceae bacterium]
MKNFLVTVLQGRRLVFEIAATDEYEAKERVLLNNGTLRAVEHDATDVSVAEIIDVTEER